MKKSSKKSFDSIVDAAAARQLASQESPAAPVMTLVPDPPEETSTIDMSEMRKKAAKGSKAKAKVDSEKISEPIAAKAEASGLKNDHVCSVRLPSEWVAFVKSKGTNVPMLARKAVRQMMINDGLDPDALPSIV